MHWLRDFIVYYILLYLLGGGIAVDIMQWTSWEAMFLMWLGCCIGHYLGKLDGLGWSRAK